MDETEGPVFNLASGRLVVRNLVPVPVSGHLQLKTQEMSGIHPSLCNTEEWTSSRSAWLLRYLQRPFHALLTFIAAEAELLPFVSQQCGKERCCWRHMSHVRRGVARPLRRRAQKRVHMSLALTSLEKHRDPLSDSSSPPRHHLPPSRRSFPLFDRGRQPRQIQFRSLDPSNDDAFIELSCLDRYNGPVPVLPPPHVCPWLHMDVAEASQTPSKSNLPAERPRAPATKRRKD